MSADRLGWLTKKDLVAVVGGTGIVVLAAFNQDKPYDPNLVAEAVLASVSQGQSAAEIQFPPSDAQ